MNATELFLGERPFTTAQLILDDVQALWGGRRVVVEGTGTAVWTTVARGGGQQTRHFSLDEQAVQRLFAVCIEVDFLMIVVPERRGVPDEARPVITLVNGNGRRHSIAKWANDKQERFDSLYRALLQLE